MSVNLADIQMVGIVLASPLAAGVAAHHGGAARFTPIYSIGGLALGTACAWLMHSVAYLLGPPIIGGFGIIAITQLSHTLASYYHHHSQ